MLQFQCNTGPVTITDTTIVSSGNLNQCASSKDVTFAAQPGQQLNISAIYFDWDQSSSSHCRQSYGRIQDSLSSNSASICAGRERDAQLMVSNGNMVDINLNRGADRGSFLLRFTGMLLIFKHESLRLTAAFANCFLGQVVCEFMMHYSFDRCEILLIDSK